MRDLARLLMSEGPVNWEIAKQLAQWAATGGEPDPNPDPVARSRLEELLRVGELNVADATGIVAPGGGLLALRAVSRTEWALRTLEDWKPLLENLASTLVPSPPLGQEAGDRPPDPMSQLLGNIPQVLGPFLFGLQAGSMVGELAGRAMGQYDPPAPRPPRGELILVPYTIDRFAADWSLPSDDARLWVVLRELIHQSILSRPHVRARLDELVGAYVGAFQPDPGAIEERLAGFDPTDMASLQAMFGNPETLLGELQSDEQRSLRVPLRTLLATLAGYVDHVMDTVGRRLIGSYGPLTEALRRRRLEESPGTRILGRLLGVQLDPDAYEQGRAFVTGVMERAGPEGLGRLWRSEKELPTPAELAAPGLWLARIELPDTEEPGQGGPS